MARTPKARALGKALRDAREGRHLTLRELGSQIGRDSGVLSRWETGERTPKPEQVAQILTKLGIAGDRYDEIMSLTYGADEAFWVPITLSEQRQQLTTFLDFEQNASKITIVSPLLVPGLLQINDYVRAMMIGGAVPAGEIAARMTVRAGRREAIRPPKPVQLLALIGEAVLHQIIGSREIMIAQLKHLVGMAKLPNIELRIIPYNSGWHPALEGLFTIIESPHSTPVVHLENRRSGWFLHEDRDVHIYQRACDMVHRASMDPSESMNLIVETVRKMEAVDG